MANGRRTVSEYLDEMALKILMVEPGDLSVVGELLELMEEISSNSAAPSLPFLHQMAGTCKQVLEKIIMGELADSAENFDLLAQCIIQMQEVVRKGGEADSGVVQAFCQHLAKVGFPVDPKIFGSQPGAEPKHPPGEDPGKQAEPEEPPTGPAEEDGAGNWKTADPDFLQDKELLAGFISESFEHLETIEVNILELENSPDDRDIINSIFRTFHTIKGVSGFLNLRIINELAHCTENLLDDIRNGKRAMDSDVIDIVLNVGDFMQTMVQNIKDVLDNGADCYQEFEISEYLERIRRIQGDESVAMVAGEEEVDLATPVEKEVDFAPAEEEVRSGSSREPEGIHPSPEAASLAAEPVPPPAPPRPETGATAPGRQPPPRKAAIGDAIKVDVEKLDSLVNAVGELVIMQSLVRQNPSVASLVDQKLTRDFSQLSRITTEVQRTAMSMRMVPIRQTFQKMIRLVRDLSKKSGKQVELVMLGEETEIDRNMVDSIYDPLVHMIRNSVDHGVQMPQEREKLGKAPAGTVHLRAYQKGGNIVIEIEDDGHGLNAGKIRQKALERGLIQKDEQLTDHEIHNLIFLPGFSTADKITDVSGRGVGMDVVKKAVEKLRGKVEVQSTPGAGSLFLIRLPLTLAIIDGIVVRIGTERYIIPTTAIQESMRATAENYNTVHGRGETLLIREGLVPIIRLYEKFGVEPSSTDPLATIMVIVENEGRRRALMVDELLGKQEVVIKSLGGFMQDTRGVAGGTILGDGRVGLILDLAGLMDSGSGGEAAGTGAGAASRPAGQETVADLS